jgi:nucleoside-diphosphate-sugar epimerase
MGRGELSPVYVDDLVEGVVLAAGRKEAEGHAFTLTGGVTVEAREFFGRYASMLGKQRVAVAPTPVVLAIAATLGRAASLAAGSEVTVPAVRYIARKGSYSIDKARTVLGYAPAVDLDAGMRRCEEWLRGEGLVPTRV